MKYLIKINNSTFSVSNSFINAIIENNLDFQVINHKGKQIHLLNDSCLSSFLTIPTASPTHLYVLISNKHYRIIKPFYNFLVEHSNTVVEATRKKNETLDKFYTNPEVSKYCVDVFTSNILIQKRDLVVEPSAGNGSFIKALEKINCNKIFLDIAPEKKQIRQVNFLE